jgi:YHS domain-containing protein
MKKLIALLCVVALFSCNKKETNAVTEKISVVEKKNPLNDLKYDNKIDFYCKMDIKVHGVYDTVHYKGKLYGFCSKMCKDEFLKKPDEYLAENKK